MIISAWKLETKRDLAEALTKIAEPVTLRGNRLQDLPSLSGAGVKHTSERSRIETLLRGYWGTFILDSNGSDATYISDYLELFGKGTDPKRDSYWGDLVGPVAV